MNQHGISTDAWPTAKQHCTTILERAYKARLNVLLYQSQLHGQRNRAGNLCVFAKEKLGYQLKVLSSTKHRRTRLVCIRAGERLRRILQQIHDLTVLKIVEIQLTLNHHQNANV